MSLLPAARHGALQWEETLPVASAVAILHGHDFAGPFKAAHVSRILDVVMFPVFAILGAWPGALRAAEVLLSLCAALLAAAAVRRVAGRRASLLALGMILFHSSFFIYAKVSFIGDIATQQLLVAAAALAFAGWLQRPGSFRAFWMGLALGWGVYGKLLLLWQLPGYCVSAGWLRARQSARAAAREALACVAGGLLNPWTLSNLATLGGSSQGVFDQWRRRAEIFRQLASDLGRPGYGPLDYVRQRMAQAAASLVFYPALQRDYLRQAVALSAAWFPLMAVPYAALACYLLRGERSDARRAATAWALVAALYYLGLWLPAAYPGSDHVLPALPLALMASAIALDRLLPSSRALAAVLAMAYGGHALADLRSEALGPPSGRGRLAGAAAFFRSHDIASPAAVMPSAETVAELSLLSEGTVKPRHCRPELSREVCYRSWLQDRRTWYITYPIHQDRHRLLFERLAASSCLHPVEVHRFSAGDEAPVAIFRMEAGACTASAGKAAWADDPFSSDEGLARDPKDPPDVGRRDPPEVPQDLRGS